MTAASSESPDKPAFPSPKLIKFARIFLVLNAIVLLAYALPFLGAPQILGKLVQLEFAGPNAFIEIRAFYGGLELGIALYLIWSALAIPRTPYALMMVGFVFWPAGASRAWGILQYGTVGPAHIIVALIEIAVASLALVTAHKLLRRR